MRFFLIILTGVLIDFSLSLSFVGFGGIIDASSHNDSAADVTIMQSMTQYSPYFLLSCEDTSTKLLCFFLGDTVGISGIGCVAIWARFVKSWNHACTAKCFT